MMLLWRASGWAMLLGGAAMIIAGLVYFSG
jgi:hypothetical protein